MKKSNVLLIGAAAVCMGLFIRKRMKHSVCDVKDPKGSATAPVHQTEKPDGKETAPAAAEEPASAAGSPTTTPRQKELTIVSQNTDPTKAYVERRKKQYIEKNRQAKKMKYDT